MDKFKEKTLKRGFWGRFRGQKQEDKKIWKRVARSRVKAEDKRKALLGEEHDG